MAIPVRWNIKSVLAGYFRWYAWLILVIAMSPVLLDVDRAWVPAVIAASIGVSIYVGTWSFLLWPFGKRRRQRLIVGALTTLYVLPEVLHDDWCRGVLAQLETMLDERKISRDPEFWRERLPEKDEAPFVYAWLLYADRFLKGASCRVLAWRLFPLAATCLDKRGRLRVNGRFAAAQPRTMELHTAFPVQPK